LRKRLRQNKSRPKSKERKLKDDTLEEDKSTSPIRSNFFTPDKKAQSVFSKDLKCKIGLDKKLAEKAKKNVSLELSLRIIANNT
jgi:hypothetical protein